MNDYMAAYHDAVLLIGQVMRKIIEKNASEVLEMAFMNVNYFRNTSFNGKKEREPKYSRSQAWWESTGVFSLWAKGWASDSHREGGITVIK